MFVLIQLPITVIGVLALIKHINVYTKTQYTTKHGRVVNIPKFCIDSVEMNRD